MRIEHVGVDRRAQGLLELILGDRCDAGEQVVGHPLTRSGGHPDDVAGRLVESLETDEEQVGEVLGQAPPAAEEGADQLLDVERVALGALHDPLDVVVVLLAELALAADDLLDQATHRTGRQRVELDPLDTGEPHPLGDPLAQRVAAVHLVGAEGHDAQAPALEPAGEQEADQVTRARIGPVRVLDDEEDGAESSEVLEEREHRLEDLGTVEPLGGVVCRQSVAHPRERRMELVLDELGGDLAHLGEHLREGEVGHRGLAEVETVADEGTPSVGGEAVDRLGQQAGLAYACIAREEHHPGLFWSGGSTEQGLELAVPADEALGPAPVNPHIGHHPARCAARRHQRRPARAAMSSRL